MPHNWNITKQFAHVLLHRNLNPPMANFPLSPSLLLVLCQINILIINLDCYNVLRGFHLRLCLRSIIPARSVFGLMVRLLPYIWFNTGRVKVKRVVTFFESKGRLGDGLCKADKFGGRGLCMLGQYGLCINCLWSNLIWIKMRTHIAGCFFSWFMPLFSTICAKSWRKFDNEDTKPVI